MVYLMSPTRERGATHFPLKEFLLTNLLYAIAMELSSKICIFHNIYNNNSREFTHELPGL